MKAVEKITFESRVIFYYNKIKENNKYEFSIFCTAQKFKIDEARVKKIVSARNKHVLENVFNSLKYIF